jgi:ribosomal protein L7/L12
VTDEVEVRGANDDRTVKVEIQGAGYFYVTAREAHGLAAMLKGMRAYDLESGRTVEVTLHDTIPPAHAIGAIKTIRTLTGWDLKTSKEAWDRRPLKLRIDAVKVPEVEATLNSAGIVYSGLSIVERIAKMDQSGAKP